MDFITENDEHSEDVDVWQTRFNQSLSPLIMKENRTKRVYRNRFWMNLLLAIFIICAYALYAFYNFRMHEQPINFTKIAILSAIGIIMIVLPLKQYSELKKEDIFAKFVELFGGWKCVSDAQLKMITLDILPQHDDIKILHKTTGEYSNTAISISDVIIQKNIEEKDKKLTISSGVLLEADFPSDFAQRMVFVERKGGKKLFTEAKDISKSLYIPAANYFYIYATEAAKSIIHSVLINQLLDIRDVFKAKRIDADFYSNKMYVYLENAEFYIMPSGLWHKPNGKNKYFQSYKQLEQILALIYVLLDLKGDTQ